MGLCQTTMVPLSTHCAPHLHLHAALACKQLRHIEYFFDHFRHRADAVRRRAPTRRTANSASDPTRPGIGLELRRADAERYAFKAIMIRFSKPSTLLDPTDARPITHAGSSMRPTSMLRD